MLFTSVWGALQALDTTQNNLMVRNPGEMMYLFIVINSCLWKIVQKCIPGPAEASKLSLDGPCDPLTGPGQDHDEPDVPELGSNFIFFYALQLLLQPLV